MSAISKVIKRRVEFEIATGKKPTRVYVDAGLASALERELAGGVDAKRPPSILIDGMRVFVVDDNQHLACGWKAGDEA